MQSWGVAEFEPRPQARYPSLAFLELAAPVLTWRASSGSGSNLTTYTFSAMALGPPSPDRIVVVLVFGQDSAGGPGDAPSTVTVAGNTTTIHVSGVGTGTNETSSSVCSILDTTNTTGDVVVTWPDAQVRCGVAVYSLTDYNSATPTATAGAEAESTSVAITLDVGRDQIGVIGSNVNSGSTQDCTWTNAVENSEFVLETNDEASVATLATGSGNVSRTATWSATGSLTIAGAVWR